MRGAAADQGGNVGRGAGCLHEGDVLEIHRLIDFDDALSIRQLANGNWEIGVHIADVTHYVDTHSALEREAFRRATSVYLVDRTIPMLPEKLSNELCSLRPHEDKLTFSAVFEMDEQARIKSQWFGRTVIHSDRRFAYEEGIRSPFIVRYPPLVTAGSMIHDLVLTLDVAPTLIEVAGGMPGGHIQGRSLLPLFAGQSAGCARRLIDTR